MNSGENKVVSLAFSLPFFSRAEIGRNATCHHHHENQ